MPYIGRSSNFGVRTRFLYTATASQTTFSGTDTQNLTLSYSDSNFIDVHQNGVLLKVVDDYTATSGTSVVLATGATASDVIEITVYDVFSIANHIKKTGDAMAGALTNIDIDGTELVLDADGDTSITADTDDQIDIKIAGSDSLRIKANEIENVSGDLTLDIAGDLVVNADGGNLVFQDDGVNVGELANSSNDFVVAALTQDKDIIFKGNDGGSVISAMILDFSEGGNVLIGTTYGGIQVSGVSMTQDGNVDIGADANPLDVNRQGNDGSLIRFYQAGSEEGEIQVSGSTVSLSGFQGSHESSGIPSNTPVGTVVSTIDTIDTKTIIAEDGSKSQQDRADHPKIEVSNSVGDKAVYGVFARWRTIEENKDVKAMIASVGTGSVRVTGACAKGDLLESNGDGTAKVQSDDIVRSKTIGKVTIGNSDTGVKLVSCVLYCG